MTRQDLWSAALLAGALTFASAHAQYVRLPPPGPVAEHPDRAPGQGYAWVPGYQRWDGHGYVWERGRWVVPPRPGAHWVPGRWLPSPRGWHWMPGHWRA